MQTKNKTSSGGRRSQIPDDIIFHNILSRVPVSSLCRWKLVSKPWCNFIKDPVFDDEIRPKTQPQWIRLLPPVFIARHEDYDMDVFIYSVKDSGASETILERYVPHPKHFLLRQYDGLVCCYHDSFQLTVFNTTTRETTNISLPSLKGYDFFRNFEYGFDPLSKRYKVLTFKGDRGTNGGDPVDDECSRLSNFQIITLGEDNLAWRSLEHVPKIESLSYWATIVNGKIYWFVLNESFKPRKRLYAQIISFNFTTEEFATTPLPETKTHLYFKRPLFEYEGSLCYVENTCIRKRGTSNITINVWMLKDDVIGVWVPMAKNMILSLIGTQLEIFGSRRFYPEEHSTLKDVEFSIYDGKLVVAAYDNKDQYVYWCSFLNGQCKRIKIIGQPFRHPTVQKYIEDYGEEDG